MIKSAFYTSVAPSQAVAITMADGTIWYTDASLPADTEIRRMLADWLSAGGVIAPYVAPPIPVPASITRRQCARQMHAMKLISGPEMVAMTRNGQPPAMVAVMLSALPDEERWVAEADFAADAYERNNPLLKVLVSGHLASQGIADAGQQAQSIDQFFRDAGQL